MNINRKIDKSYAFVSLTRRQFNRLLPRMAQSIDDLSAQVAATKNKKDAVFFERAIVNFTKGMAALKAAQLDPSWPEDRAGKIRLTHEHYFMVKAAAQENCDSLRQALAAAPPDAAALRAQLADDDALLAELEESNPRRLQDEERKAA